MRLASRRERESWEAGVCVFVCLCVCLQYSTVHHPSLLVCTTLYLLSSCVLLLCQCGVDLTWESYAPRLDAAKTTYHPHSQAYRFVARIQNQLFHLTSIAFLTTYIHIYIFAIFTYPFCKDSFDLICFVSPFPFPFPPYIYNNKPDHKPCASRPKELLDYRGRETS